MMNQTALALPERASKPRSQGLTMMIDGGLPLGQFHDVVTSACEYLDFVKFGWGTAVVTQGLQRKIDILRAHGVDHYFGGTLFEKHLLQGRLDEYRRFCQAFSCHYVEASNGTIDLTNTDKARYVAELAKDFRVISEVGFKDPDRSAGLEAADWITCIEEDLEAGACLVTLESRESGRSGICQSNGEVRQDILEALLSHGSLSDHLLFEAPSTALQAYFVQRLGPDVNLGNIASSALLGLETLRLGLRADTLTCFEPVAR
jgi:phosphosulfolactate synthase